MRPQIAAANNATPSTSTIGTIALSAPSRWRAELMLAPMSRNALRSGEQAADVPPTEMPGMVKVMTRLIAIVAATPPRHGADPATEQQEHQRTEEPEDGARGADGRARFGAGTAAHRVSRR